MPTPDSSDETIFAGALAQPAAERPAFLNRACASDPARRARIESLLRAHEGADAQFMATAPSSAPIVEPATGERIGRYKLLQKIGEGGCGVVYMAEQQEPVVRRVALKVIKLGMDTKEVVARFEAERQALALMDHANIARVFDGGATDTGRPFFVMELVRGVPITKFCDEQNLATTARLELFTQVCHAVQHAHQKGIIHRDLKPSNILVTLHDGTPVPKVIDFGIAKATQGRLTESTVFTAFEQFIGTPAYMSPEQAEMSGLDIDTRSDIYSLGVLLYELLTGRPPFDPKTLLSAGLDEIRRIIREVEPPKPSTNFSTLNAADSASVAKLRATDPAKLSLLISGDLDWIVMKALEKNRARRYDTPSEFAADIARHLGHEPVLARPPSTAYRLGKTIRRNKLAFAAGGAIAAALVVGLSVSTWMFFRERDARERAVAAELQQTALRRRADTDRERAVAAERHQSELRTQAERDRERAVAAERTATDEAAISRAVSSFLTDDLLRQADSTAQAGTDTAPNPDLKMREALDRAGEKVGPRFKAQPATEAAVRSAIGAAYLGVGDFAKGVLHYERAVELRKAALGSEHRATLEAMSSLAAAYHSHGKRAEAAALGTETLAAQRRTLGPEHPAVLLTMHNLATAYHLLERPAEATALRVQVLESSRRVLGPEHPNTLIAMTNLAASRSTEGKWDECATLSAQAWEIQKRVLGAEHPRSLTSMINLAVANFNLGKRTQGVALYSQMLEIQTRVRGPDHPSTLWSMNGLAALYEAQGQRTEAAALRAQALEVQNRVLGPDHPHTLASTSNQAGTFLLQGRNAEAAALGARAWEGQKRVLGAEHRDTLTSMRNLATALQAQGKQDQAAALFAELLELQQRVLGPEHPVTLETMHTLAQIYRAQGRNAEAIPLQSALLEIQHRVLGPKHTATLTTMRTLGATKEVSGDIDGAETLLRTLLSLSPKPDDSPRAMLGWVLVKQGKFAEAETLLRPVQILRDEMMPNLWITYFSRSSLGGALAGQGKQTEAEPLLVSGVEGLFKRIDTISAVDKRRVREAFEHIVQFYTAWKKPEQAAEWQKKLDEYNAYQKSPPAAKL
jgi:eukaryotic-like serine/threonine-protein kinase